MEDKNRLLGSFKCALDDRHLICCAPVELNCGVALPRLACSACAKDQTDYLGNYVCPNCHLEHALDLTNSGEAQTRYKQQVAYNLFSLSKSLLEHGNRAEKSVQGLAPWRTEFCFLARQTDGGFCLFRETSQR